MLTFCKSVNNIFSMQQNRFFTSTKTFAYNNQNVLNKTRFVVLINSLLWVYVFEFEHRWILSRPVLIEGKNCYYLGKGLNSIIYVCTGWSKINFPYILYLSPPIPFVAAAIFLSILASTTPVSNIQDFPGTEHTIFCPCLLL